MTIIGRSVLFGALALVATGFQSSGRASTVNTAQLEATVCPTHPDATTLKALKAAVSDFQCNDDAAHTVPKPAAVQSHPTKPIQTAAPHKPQPPTDQSGDFKPSVLLRNSWSDLGWLGGACMAKVGGDSGVSAAGSKGATLSFERDYANNNNIWTVQGMAAGVLSYCPSVPLTSHYTGLIGESLAMYGQANTIYDSNPQFTKKNNNDTRTAGLVGEVAYVSSGDFNVFRVAPNVVFDNVNDTTAVAVMAQYAPAWIQSFEYLWAATPIYEGGPSFQFNPVFDLQYTSAMEHSKPLQFDGKDQSLRLGPELTFILTPIGGSVLNRIGFSETFHPWYEVYNSRASSYWWDNSIFYNITDDGNFSIKLSYDRGQDQNSGIMTNQYILGFAGKY